MHARGRPVVITRRKQEKKEKENIIGARNKKTRIPNNLFFFVSILSLVKLVPRGIEMKNKAK